ncbi:MAG: [protein-PII] uridylyltransferase, partial [Sciscionella sp.]|nr:[protein-PII] uridylyltransferase [Sciscionella sp.]
MTDSAAELVEAREALLASDASPARLRAGLAALYRDWLVERIDGVDGVAVIAVGAFGRGELLPYSDLDLVLLHGDNGQPPSRANGTGVDSSVDSAVESVAERLWYPLWDAGIGLDHSVRTPAQALDVASGDLRVALGLLEARHIAGAETLSNALRDKAFEQWRRLLPKRFDDLVSLTKQRWRAAGDLPQRAEPDLKNGRGGQRDVQLLRALAAGQLADAGGADVAAANTVLLDVRTR